MPNKKEAPGKQAGKGAAAAPDPAHLADMRSIRPVELDMHSDAISHWQDEPQGPRGKPDEAGKDKSTAPAAKTKDKRRSS